MDYNWWLTRSREKHCRSASTFSSWNYIHLDSSDGEATQFLLIIRGLSLSEEILNDPLSSDNDDDESLTPTYGSGEETIKIESDGGDYSRWFTYWNCMVDNKNYEEIRDISSPIFKFDGFFWISLFIIICKHDVDLIFFFSIHYKKSIK